MSICRGRRFERLVALGFASLVIVSAAFGQSEFTVRVKDVATVQGIRDNQLVGVGIVTGLSGRGDSTNSRMTKSSLSNLLAAFGLRIDAGDIRSKNSAVVAVTATAPSSALPGDRLDIHVASLGDATDLGGGMLLQTNLRAANGRTYAVAQGVVSTTGEGTARTSGTIPNGAIVENAVGETEFATGALLLVLNDADFTSASNLSTQIAARFPDAAVRALNASVIEIVPDSGTDETVENTGPFDFISFIASVEQVRVVPDAPARVVIDESSGVIVLGGNVRIAPVGISYRDRTMRIQPVSIYDTPAEQTFMVSEGASVADFVLILKELEVETDVIIDMIKLIDKAGALYGELTIE